MNTITWIVAIFTLWLVMGLGFASAWSDYKRRNRPLREALGSAEGILLIASIVIPLMAAAFGAWG